MDTDTQKWTYLYLWPHQWRQQLSVKGGRILASTLYNDMIANDQTAEEIADDYGLPLPAVLEAIRYSEKNIELIRAEVSIVKSKLGGLLRQQR